jgi:hypothetical protein
LRWRDHGLVSRISNTLSGAAHVRRRRSAVSKHGRIEMVHTIPDKDDQRALTW